MKRKIITIQIISIMMVIGMISFSYADANSAGFQTFNNAPRKSFTVNSDKLADVKITLKDNNKINSVELYSVDEAGKNQKKIEFSNADTKNEVKHIYTLSHEKLLKGQTKRFYIKIKDGSGNVQYSTFKVCVNTKTVNGNQVSYYKIDDSPRVINWEANDKKVNFDVKDMSGIKYVKIQDRNNQNKEIYNFENLKASITSLTIDMNKFKAIDDKYSLKIITADMGEIPEKSTRTVSFRILETSEITNVGTGENKKVSNKKINKTLRVSDLRRIKTVSPTNSSCTIAQGFCVTDKYFVCALINHSDTKTVLQIYDKNTKKLKNKLTGNLNHANGMAYNKHTQKIYIANCVRNKYTVISSADIGNTKTLKKSTRYLKTQLSSITYDPYTNQYYMGKGNKFYRYDSTLKDSKKFNKKICHTTQDVGAYRGLVLVIDYNKGTRKSAIDIYRASNGAYLGRYTLGISPELESIQYDEDHKCFYLYCNTGRNGIIYKTTAINLENYWI